jgi:predicted PurR-regulated permease PerM
MAEQAMNTATSILRSLFSVLAVLLLASFWAIEGDRAIRFLLLGVPSSRREAVREFIDELKSKVGAYTRGIVILSSIIGLFQMIAYFIIGLPNALLLGILAAIGEVIPLIGPLLGAIPALIVAVAFDPTKVIWVIVATMIIQALENNIVAPRVMDRQVGVNPVATLLAFVAFGTIFGFIGALLAIPLAALIQMVLNRLLFKAAPPETVVPAGRDTISILRYEAQDLMQDVRKQVRNKEGELDDRTDQMEDAMESVIMDLDSILAQLENGGSGTQKETGGLA